MPTPPCEGENIQQKNRKAFLDLMHDVRNPMAVIYTSFEILFLKKWREDNQEELHRHLKVCKSQLDRIRVMLGNYTDLMRMEDIPILRTEENISKLMKSVLDSFSPRFIVEKKSILLDSRVEMHSVDRNIFKQMVHNMIEHTLFFAETGSETTLTAIEKEGGLILEIHYSGGGIKPEETGRIFESNERVVDQKNGVKYNKGFGLSYNLLMAEHLGGSFSFSVHPETLAHQLLLTLP